MGKYGQHSSVKLEGKVVTSPVVPSKSGHFLPRMDKLKCSRKVLSSVAILCLCGLHLCFGQGRTFFGDGSYLVAEPFQNELLLLRFTFQTSELHGLLLCSDISGDDFIVELRNGSLVIENNLDGDKSTDEFNDILNDDNPHTVTIYHDATNQRFFYRLDSVEMPNTYAAHLQPNFGTRGLYFGRGKSATGRPLFVGCLRDILFSNGGAQGLNSGISSTNLQAVPVTAMGMFGNCSSPCDGVDCGSGTCVVRWPDEYFCDCRGSNQLGPSCSESELQNRK